jgi:spermidine synthase
LPIIIFLILGIGGIFLSEEIKKQQGVVDVDTQYQRIQIVDVLEFLTKEPVRYLKTDPYGSQSAMFLDDHDLVLKYQKFYRLSRHFRPDLKYSLMIGGGAFSYPKDYLKMFPEAKIDVVEIDPELTLLARRYFNLKDDTRMLIFSEDGRTFLNKTKNKYDAILIDAFKSYFVPYQLTTKEAVEKIYDSLDEKGIVLLNIISSVNGEKGKFLRAEYATYKKFFPQVYLFLVKNKEAGDRAQNIMLVALKSEEKPVFENNDAELQEYLSCLWIKEIKNDTPILTDDFAPVDNYLAKIQKNIR